MHYVIIAIIVIGIIILLGKHVLFNPRVNSIIGIICYILLISLAWRREIGISIIAIILISIAIIDCIRDIIIAENYYEDIEIAVDKLYMIKSLTSILTLGFARVIFLLVVGPLLSYSVSSDVKRKIQSGYPLPHSSCYSRLEAKNYYYAKRIDRLEKEGAVISNIKTVNSEAKIRRKKLDSLYPEKLLAKMADMVAGDKDMKAKRKEAEAKLNSYSLKKCYAYLSSSTFERLPQLLSEVMSKKPPYSVSYIKNFEELKALNLTISFVSYDNKNTDWSEYFIIQALQPLVSDGTFQDFDWNDNDPFDNHVYQYTKSVVQMKSIDGDTDPLFALDD